MKPLTMKNHSRAWIVFCACCASCSGNSTMGAGDLGTAAGAQVVVNELYPHGATAMDPDWAEIKNITKRAVDVSGYKVRDGSLANLYKLPDGTSIPAGGYLVVFCDDQTDGGVVGGIHTPWKLSGKKGDEFHLVGPDGKDVDATGFTADLASTKSWGRLPDGTGQFIATSPTRGAANL